MYKLLQIGLRWVLEFSSTGQVLRQGLTRGDNSNLHFSNKRVANMEEKLYSVCMHFDLDYV